MERGHFDLAFLKETAMDNIKTHHVVFISTSMDGAMTPYYHLNIRANSAGAACQVAERLATLEEKMLIGSDTVAIRILPRSTSPQLCKG